jgi:hypothetical protein
MINMRKMLRSDAFKMVTAWLLAFGAIALALFFALRGV